MDLVKKRRRVIGGNWKMYKDPAGTTSFFDRWWSAPDIAKS